MATRLETPRMMPSIVRSDLNLWAQISRMPARMVMPSCAKGWGAVSGVGLGCGGGHDWAARGLSADTSRALHSRQGQIDLHGDLAVADFDAPGRDGGDFGVVGDEDDGAAFVAELAEELENGVPGVRIEVAGGFVGEDDARDC